jgi:tetratricopeptide (TPR) repeat protein
MLNELGQREAALASTREAVALFRTFAVHNTDAFQPHLAMSLEVLGSILIDAGECEVALAILREVMDLYRALATRNADAFQPDIVRSLNNLGRTLSDLGQYEEALEAMQEALDLIWPLFVQIPHVHVNLTGNILRTIRCLHGVLSREPSTEFVEREARFAEFAGTQT